MSADKPTIDVQEKSPFIVKGLQKLTASDGRPVPMEKDVVALCRCGGSQSKPFCDGTHRKTGFTGARERTDETVAKEYAGRELTIVDDRGICSHAGECAHGAPAVFFKHENGERIAQPDAGQREQTIATIRKCPSGSLAYKLDGRLHDAFFHEPEIFVSKDGPLHVRGGIVLNHDRQPPSREHYALCRCGASKNKPFCDGAHADVGFKA